MPSFVIPAHEEAEVIARCLDSILSHDCPDDLEVAVVCNGCTDDTARIARNHDKRVRVIETDVASKSRSLNLGDEAVTSFPRMYLDADVELGPNALSDTFNALGEGTLAVSPSAHFDLSRSSLFVRMFYAAWTKMPFYNDSMIGGSGAYALSQEGRDRFECFPDLISDDGFVRLHYKAKERSVVRNASSTVSCPRRMADLLKMMTRVTAGRRQLHREYPQLLATEETTGAGKVAAVIRSPLLWPCFAIYAFTRLVASHRERRQRNQESTPSWLRDDSSRVQA